MQLFYTQHINPTTALLEGDEFRHAIKTLRHKEGDRLMIMDGQGHYYQTEIVKLSKKEAELKILEKEEKPLPWNFQLHLAIAPTKNIDRIEWCLEKAIEIGINAFTPLLCRYSERKRIRTDRLERIALAAAKQSHKSVLPIIHPLTSYEEFVQKEQASSKFIAHCQTDELKEFKIALQPASSIVVLIGPEGDFSEQEVQLAEANGFQAISLGKSRLRTETAGVVACHTVQLCI